MLCRSLPGHVICKASKLNPYQIRLKPTTALLFTIKKNLITPLAYEKSLCLNIYSPGQVTILTFSLNFYKLIGFFFIKTVDKQWNNRVNIMFQCFGKTKRKQEVIELRGVGFPDVQFNVTEVTHSGLFSADNTINHSSL